MDLSSKKSEMELQEMTEEDILDTIRYSLNMIGPLAEIFRAYRLYIAENVQVFRKAAQHHLEFEKESMKCLDMKQGGKEMSTLKRKTFAKQAEESIVAFQEIQLVATSYYQLSKTHFEPMLSTLGKCKSLDPERESEQLRNCIADLENQTHDSQDGIQCLIEENNKRRYKAKMIPLLQIDGLFGKSQSMNWTIIGLIGILVSFAVLSIYQFYGGV